MSVLRFLIDLKDYMSPRVRNIRAELGALGRALESTRLKIDRLYIATSGLRALTLTMFAGVAAAGGVGVIALGKLAIQAGSFKESAMAAFTVLAGGADAAKRIYNQAIQFAAITPFTTEQVIKNYQDLLANGFKEKEIPIVLSAVGDLSSMRGFSQEAVDSVMRAISQIRTMGKLQQQDLNQLGQAGLPLQKFYEVLGKKINKTTGEVKKLQEAGKIDSKLAVWGVLETVRTTISGGKLGNMMDKQSKTLSGIWSTLISRPFEMLQNIDEKGGFKSLKGFLSNLADGFNTTNERGQRMSDSLVNLADTLFTSIFGPLESATKGDGLAAWIDKANAFLVRFGKAWNEYFPQVMAGLKGFAAGVGSVLTPLSQMVGGMVRAFGGGAGGAEKLGELIGKVIAFAGVLSLLVVPLKWLFSIVGAFQALGGVVRSVIGWGPALGRFFGFFRLGSILAWLRPIVAGLAIAFPSLGSALAVLTGPVGWVVGAVMALGGAAVYAYNHFEWFRNAVNFIWDSIKSGFQLLTKSIWNGLKIFWGLITGDPAARNVGAALVEGLKSGFSSAWGGFTTWLNTKWTELSDGVKNFFGIHSPSTMFADFGNFMMDGLKNGILSGVSGVGDSLRSMAYRLGDIWNRYAPALGLPTIGGGGGLAGGSGGTTGGGTGFSIPAGVTGGSSRIAQAAIAGLTSGWAEEMPGYCSRFVRQVFAHTLGPKTASLFAGTAIATERKWAAAGLTKSLSQVGGAAGLKAGDVLFQGFGSGGAGHTGIYVGNGMVAQNTTMAGGGKKLLPLSSFGSITSVGRLPDVAGAARTPAPSPSSTAPRAPSGAKAPAPAARGGGAVVHVNLGTPAGATPADKAKLRAAAHQGAHEGVMAAFELLAIEGGHA